MIEQNEINFPEMGGARSKPGIGRWCSLERAGKGHTLQKWSSSIPKAPFPKLHEESPDMVFKYLSNSANMFCTPIHGVMVFMDFKICTRALKEHLSSAPLSEILSQSVMSLGIASDCMTLAFKQSQESNTVSGDAHCSSRIRATAQHTETLNKALDPRL